MILGQIERTIQQRAGQILLGALVVCFAVLGIVGTAAMYMAGRSDQQADIVVSSYRTEVLIGEVRWLLEQTEATRRGFLLTGDPSFLTRHDRALVQLGSILPSLAAAMPEGSRDSVMRIARLVEVIARDQRMAIRLARSGERERALAMFRRDNGARSLMQARDDLRSLSMVTARQLDVHDRRQRAVRRDFFHLFFGMGLLVMVIALIAALLVRRQFRALSDIATALDGANRSLRDMTDTLEERVAIRTADLHEANQEIQRFAYVVSHDLRAPLVNVVGFTAEMDRAVGELRAMMDAAAAGGTFAVTPAARAAIDDLPEAIGFIRSSTQKMDRLILAILRLAREGKRLLVPEPVDTGAMVREVAAATKYGLDDWGVDLHVADAMPVVITDWLALEQILSNLIENAGKYRHPDRPPRIEVAGAVDAAGWTTLSVRDNGRGIDPRDHDRIFELFRRAGRQDQPGEGIGLAYVRTLVQRLGARIAVDSRLGDGAVFTLTLPPAPQESPVR